MASDAEHGEAVRPTHVIIVGGGFGGLAAARALRRAPVRVTLIDRGNHHLFQPLLYQVATSVLTPGQIGSPLREIFRRQKNVTVIMGEVTGVDRDQQRVFVNSADRKGAGRSIRLPDCGYWRAAQLLRARRV